MAENENIRSPPGIVSSVVGDRASNLGFFLARTAGRKIMKPIYSPNNIVNTLTSFETTDNGLKEFEQNLKYSGDDYENFTEFILNKTSQISNYDQAKHITKSHIMSIIGLGLHDVFNRFMNGNSITRLELKDIEDATGDDFERLLFPFFRREYWYSASTFIPPTLPIRKSAKVIFSLGECIFLLALRDVSKGISLHDLREDPHRNLIETAISRSKNADSESILEAKSLLARLKIGHFDEDYRTIRLEKVFPVNKAMHIATQTAFVKERLHHSAYIGNMLVVEAFSNLFPDNTIDAVISIKHIYDLLKTARNDNSKLFYIPYTSPFTFRIIRKRSLWALGKFPSYKLISHNCESVVSWIFQNETGPPPHCIIPDWNTREKIDNKSFWNDLLFPIRGGKRFTRKLKRK